MARGFGSTLGVGATDAITSALTTHNTQRSWSIWVWRNGAGASSGGRIFSKGAAGSQTVDFYNNNASSLYQFDFKWTAIARWTIASPATGAWHHFLIVYDASSTANDPLIWMDGNAVTVTRSIAPSGSVTTDSAGVVLGNIGGIRNWDGKLGEFAVWNALLGQTEATALGSAAGGYDGKSALYYPTNLAEYIPMNDSPVTSKVLANPTVTGTASATHLNIDYPPQTSNQNDAVSVTESITVSVSDLPTVSINQNDSVTLTEFVHVPVNVPTQSEDVVAWDLSNQEINYWITVTDSTTVVVQTPAPGNLSVDSSDSITLSESATVNLALMLNTGDAVTVAEFAIPGLNIPTQFESIAVTDFAASSVVLNIIQVDSITILDGVVFDLLLMPNISDTVTLTDLAVLAVKLTLFDSITISDSVIVSGLGRYTIDTSDSVTVAELPTILLAKLFVTANDPVSIAEFVNFTINLIQGDIIAVTDSLALYFSTLSIAADDAVTILEFIDTSFVQPIFITVFDNVFLLTAPPIDIFKFDVVTTDENTTILGPLIWSSVGSLGSAGSKTANQASLNLVTTANLEIGRVAVVLIAVDNNQTTDGDEVAVTSLTDSAGNTYTKAREFTNGQGAAQGGATVSVWYTKATVQLNSGQQITATFSNATSRDASAITAWKFDLAVAGSISVAGSTTLANDAADPGSMDLALSNAEYLWIRATAHERPSTDTFTKTVAYQGIFDKNGTSGGTANTNMTVAGEWDIAIGASNASNPAWSTGADEAGVLVALLLTPSIAPNVNEALVVSESISLLLPTLPLSVDDPISVSELSVIAIAGIANLAISTSDGATLTDICAVAIRQLFIDQNDSVTLADALTIQIGAAQFIPIQTGENVAVGENIPLRVNLNVIVNDVVRLYQVDPALITVVDTLTVSEFAQIAGATTVGLSIAAFENVVVNIPEIHPVDSITLSEAASIIGTGQEWFSIGSIGSIFSKSADQSSLVLQVQTTAAVGTVVVLMIAVDNAATVDGDEGAVTGVSDQSGNVWQKVGEFTNANAAAQSGATISAWFSQLSAQLDINEIVTVTFSNPTLRDASALTGWNFGRRVSGNAFVAAVTTRADDSSDPGSMNLALPLGEALWIRGTAHEGPLTDTFVKTIPYDAMFDKQGTSGGVNNTNMTIAAEFRIFYGTSNPSDPSWTVAADEAGILFALKLSSSLAANVADSLSIAEFTAVLLPVLKLATNELITAADVVSVQSTVALTSMVFDAIAVADFIALSGSLSLSHNDAITIADASSLFVAIVAAVGDTISTTDTAVTALAQLTLSVSETVTVFDILAVLQVGTSPVIATGEDVIVSELAFAVLPWLTIVTADSPGASDASSVAPTLVISSTDSVTIADAATLTAVQVSPGTFADAISVADFTDLRLARLLLLAQEDVALAELAAGKLSLTVSQADGITLSDFATAIFNVAKIFIEQGDPISVEENSDPYLSIYLATDDDISTDDAPSIFSDVLVVDQQFEDILLSDFSDILYNTFNAVNAEDVSAADFAAAAFFPPLVVQEIMLSGKVSGDIILSGKLELEIKI